MLYDDPVLYHRGITVFKDFSNPDTFYFLPPEAPRIARSAEGTGNYALRLVIFRPDLDAPLPEGMEDGGGFLNLDVDLHVSEELLEEVREEVRRKFGGQGNLVPVPFMSGSVELVLLGTTRDDEGGPFVRKIAGSAVPSLYGSQRAAFSVVLDRNGAALMKQVIEEGGATMALAIYHLTYAGIGPAYNLKITIDFNRVYEKLDLRLGASVSVGSGKSSFVGKAGFHLLMEELKEDRAIVVEETDPIPGENGQRVTNQEQINEIIANLMGSKWFKPSLAQVAQMANLGGQTSGSGTTTTPSPASGSGPGSGSGTQPASGSGAASGATHGSGTTTASGPASGTGTQQTPRAEWTQDSTVPAQNFPADKGVERPQPSTSGTRETLVIRGNGATAKVGASTGTLADHPITNGRLVIDVPAGQARHVEIRWPGQAEQFFHVLFAFDRPNDNQQEVNSYQQGNPQPADARFSSRSRARGATTGGGPDALRDWLRGLNNDQLDIYGYASYEEDESDTTHNMNLSNRRAQVAHRLVERLVPNRFRVLRVEPFGHAPARDNPNQIPALEPADGQPDGHGSRSFPKDRVALIKVHAKDECVLRGHWTRPAAPSGQSGSGTPSSGTPGSGTSGSGPSGSGPSGSGPSGSGTPSSEPTKVQASFEVNLEMIQREERITASYELNSRKARTREVHPQGQLLLEGINPVDYILEADLAIDFFQRLKIAASTTAQWERDGIDSINIQLRYATDGQGGYQKSRDLRLTPQQETDSWETFVLHENDDDSLPVAYWYEYRVTLHFLDDVALGDQRGAVTSIGVPDADADGWIRTTERNLVIHPRDVTPAVTVNIASGIIHYELLERAQLVLSYGPYRQNLTLSKENPEHRLVIRPEEGLEDEPLRSTGTLFYRDGARVPLPDTEWTLQELVVINEPRENMLNVQVLLSDPADQYERLEVDLRYEDENRIVETEEPLRFTEHAQIQEWSVRLEDPDRRAWQYRATLIKKSGDIDTVDWTDGPENDQLILGEPAVEVISVEVTWLMPPPMLDLLAVKVDLMYEDERNHVRWEKSELIREGHSGVFTWSIPVQDPNLRRYRYRVSEFRATGRTEGEWREDDTTKLVLIPGS